MDRVSLRLSTRHYHTHFQPYSGNTTVAPNALIDGFVIVLLLHHLLSLVTSLSTPYQLSQMNTRRGLMVAGKLDSPR